MMAKSFQTEGGTGMENDEKKLIGIKAVADYLDMSERNVHLWEKKLGLPLHRIDGHSGYRIYAYKDEIDQWLKEKDAGTLKMQGGSKKVKPVYLSTAVLAVVAIIVILVFIPGSTTSGIPAGPETFTVDNSIVQVRNSKGDIIWMFNHGKRINAGDIGGILDSTNIDEDPYNEVVACVYDPLEKANRVIALFDHDGRMIWRRRLNTKLTFNKIEIDDFYRPSPVKFTRTRSGEIRIISKWVHMERFLSPLASHNLKGELVDLYLHAGNLQTSLKLADVNGDGVDEIIVGGTNNLLFGEAILCVLPIEGFSGNCPPYKVQPEHKDEKYNVEQYMADNISPANEIHYFRFKKTPYLNKKPFGGPHFNSTDIIYFSDNIIHVALNEWVIPPKKEAIGFNYLFDRQFVLKKVTIPGDLLAYYPDLLAKGHIDIPLEELLKIYANILYRWEPASRGWIKVKSPIPD